MKNLKKIVEYTLKLVNRTDGRGEVIAVIWGVPYAGVEHANQGMAIRQMQYGMDAVQFRLKDSGKLQFLGKSYSLVTTAEAA